MFFGSAQGRSGETSDEVAQRRAQLAAERREEYNRFLAEKEKPQQYGSLRKKQPTPSENYKIGLPKEVDDYAFKLASPRKNQGGSSSTASTSQGGYVPSASSTASRRGQTQQQGRSPYRTFKNNPSTTSHFSLGSDPSPFEQQTSNVQSSGNGNGYGNSQREEEEYQPRYEETSMRGQGRGGRQMDGPAEFEESGYGGEMDAYDAYDAYDSRGMGRGRGRGRGRSPRRGNGYRGQQRPQVKRQPPRRSQGGGYDPYGNLDDGYDPYEDIYDEGFNNDLAFDEMDGPSEFGYGEQRGGRSGGGGGYREKQVSWGLRVNTENDLERKHQQRMSPQRRGGGGNDRQQGSMGRSRSQLGFNNNGGGGGSGPRPLSAQYNKKTPGDGASGRPYMGALNSLHDPKQAQSAAIQRKQKQNAYKAELEAQIEFKKKKEALEKAKLIVEDQKKDLEIASYNPWGRGGAGAPLKDAQGNAVTDLHDMHGTNNAIALSPHKTELTMQRAFANSVSQRENELERMTQQQLYSQPLQQFGLDYTAGLASQQYDARLNVQGDHLGNYGSSVSPRTQPQLGGYQPQQRGIPQLQIPQMGGSMYGIGGQQLSPQKSPLPAGHHYARTDIFGTSSGGGSPKREGVSYGAGLSQLRGGPDASQLSEQQRKRMEYARELERQMMEKKQREAAEKAKNEYEDMKHEQSMQNYNQWGIKKDSVSQDVPIHGPPADNPFAGGGGGGGMGGGMGGGGMMGGKMGGSGPMGAKSVNSPAKHDAGATASAAGLSFDTDNRVMMKERALEDHKAQLARQIAEKRAEKERLKREEEEAERRDNERLEREQQQMAREFEKETQPEQPAGGELVEPKEKFEYGAGERLPLRSRGSVKDIKVNVSRRDPEPVSVYSPSNRNTETRPMSRQSRRGHSSRGMGGGMGGGGGSAGGSDAMSELRALRQKLEQEQENLKSQLDQQQAVVQKLQEQAKHVVDTRQEVNVLKDEMRENIERQERLRQYQNLDPFANLDKLLDEDNDEQFDMQFRGPGRGHSNDDVQVERIRHEPEPSMSQMSPVKRQPQQQQRRFRPLYSSGGVDDSMSGNQMLQSLQGDTRLVYPDGHMSVVAGGMDQLMKQQGPPPAQYQQAPPRTSEFRELERESSFVMPPSTPGQSTMGQSSINVDSLFERNQDRLKGLQEVNSTTEDERLQQLLNNFFEKRANGEGSDMIGSGANPFASGEWDDDDDDDMSLAGSTRYVQIGNQQQ